MLVIKNNLAKVQNKNYLNLSTKYIVLSREIGIWTNNFKTTLATMPKMLPQKLSLFHNQRQVDSFQICGPKCNVWTQLWYVDPAMICVPSYDWKLIKEVHPISPHCNPFLFRPFSFVQGSLPGMRSLGRPVKYMTTNASISTRTFQCFTRTMPNGVTHIYLQ